MHALRLVVNELQKAAKENGGDELEVSERAGSRPPRPTATAAAPTWPKPRSTRRS